MYETSIGSIHVDSYRVVASMVRARPGEFLFNILRWLLVAIPATGCNSLLGYIQNKLAIAYRTRLTEEVMKQYLEGEGDQKQTFYKMCTYCNASTRDQALIISIQLILMIGSATLTSELEFCFK